MLTYFVNMYSLHATQSTKALRLEYDDVGDRIVEILGADGARTVDAMRRVDR